MWFIDLSFKIYPAVPLVDLYDKVIIDSLPNTTVPFDSHPRSNDFVKNASDIQNLMVWTD